MLSNDIWRQCIISGRKCQQGPLQLPSFIPISRCTMFNLQHRWQGWLTQAHDLWITSISWQDKKSNTWLNWSPVRRYWKLCSLVLEYYVLSFWFDFSWGYSFVDGFCGRRVTCPRCHAPKLRRLLSFTEPSERVLVASSHLIFFHLSSHRIRLFLLWFRWAFLPRNPMGFHHCRHWRWQNTASQSSSRQGLLLVGLRQELRSSSPSTGLDWRGTATAQRRRPICICFWILLCL